MNNNNMLERWRNRRQKKAQNHFIEEQILKIKDGQQKVGNEGVDQYLQLVKQLGGNEKHEEKLKKDEAKLLQIKVKKELLPT